MQNNMKEEFRNNWLDNQRNIERLENNNEFRRKGRK